MSCYNFIARLYLNQPNSYVFKLVFFTGCAFCQHCTARTVSYGLVEPAQIVRTVSKHRPLVHASHSGFFEDFTYLLWFLSCSFTCRTWLTKFNYLFAQKEGSLPVSFCEGPDFWYRDIVYAKVVAFLSVSAKRFAESTQTRWRKKSANKHILFDYKDCVDIQVVHTLLFQRFRNLCFEFRKHCGSL